jgi:hypothetical protein
MPLPVRDLNFPYGYGLTTLEPQMVQAVRQALDTSMAIHMVLTLGETPRRGERSIPFVD